MKYYGDHIKDEMGRVYSRHGRDEKSLMKGRHHLQDLHIGGIVILK
jgi:hypothetical protein